MKKRILAALLSLTMVVAMVASCGDKDTTSSGSSSGGSSATTGSSETTGGDEQERLTEITLPIVSEPITFTEWRAWENTYMTNYGEISAVQTIEDLTGVHIDYTCVPNAVAAEKYGLLLASGEFPNMIFDGSNGTTMGYPGGQDTAVAEGAYRDMTEMVWYYMPNYYNVLTSDPDIMQVAMSDQGRNIGIYMIRAYADGKNQQVVIQNEPAWCGLSVRQDWLDELGMELPVTVDDLHEVLVAFRDNYGAWMEVYKDGMVGQDYICSAFGVTGDFYMADEKTVGYGPITDGYKQYVTLMRDWYAEGLINPDFITSESTSILVDHQYFANNKCGYGMTYQGTCGAFHLVNGYTTEEDIYLTPVQGPVLKEGDKTVTTYQSTTACSPVMITTSVSDEDLPTLAKWLDWHYTYDYAVIQGYGTEGLSYHIDESSEWYFILEDFIKYPEEAGRTPGSIRGEHTLFNNIGFMDWRASFQLQELTGNDWSMKAYDTWGKQTDDIMVPATASFTSEEGNEYNTIYVDIETYVAEMTVQFIMGTLDIDAEWDNYVSTVESMNIARCLELKQASVDRYLNKVWALKDRQ